MITQGCKFVLNMGSTVLLARLLTPQDYGLVGMVATVTGLVGLFKDMGLSTATVQKAEINHAQISTLFWLNVVFSIATMLITAAIAPLIAWFYGEPRLIWITLVSAIGFIFGGLTVQHQALLNRQMRFGALAIIDIVSMLIGVATAIVLALNGAGYWALVLMPLAMGMSSALGVWVMCGWRPGLPVRHSGVSSMLAFGANLTGFGIINYFARNLDNLLIGRYWGAQQLGLYSKAYALLLLPINQINAPIASVALPTLSRLVDSPDRYRQAYLRIVEKLLMLTMPIMVFMIATSDWLVQLLLGSQWGETSRIFALLGIAGLIQPLANSTGWLFMSQDRAHDMFKWGFIGGTTAIVSFVAGLPWGAAGVAASYSLVWICVCMPLLFWFVGRTGPVRTIDFYRVLAPFVCTTLGTLLILLGFRKYLEVSNPLIGCAIAFGITVMTFVLILATMPAGRLALQDIKNMVVKPKA